MAGELSKADAKRIVSTVAQQRPAFYVSAEVAGYGYANSLWNEEKPEKLRTLQKALFDTEEVSDDELGFAFTDELGDLWFSNPESAEDQHTTLTPQWPDLNSKQVGDEINELATELGYDILDGIIAELRSIRQSTRFTPREFTAFVLKEASPLSQTKAADMMGIAVGNYAGKIGAVSDKIDEAERTLDIADQLKDD
jgi:hypothetical protein